MTISIYSPKKSSRLTYLLDEVFKHQMAKDYKLIHTRPEFVDEKGVKINYSGEFFKDALNIFPTGLLFEKGIHKNPVCFTSWNGCIAMFPTDGPDIPFDIFSAIFYLLSRYEEYLSDSYDDLGRFRAKSSLAFQNNFLEIPVINYWINDVSHLLRKKFPGFEPAKQSYSFIPTIDIDNAFAFKHKGFFRTSAALAKKLILFQFTYLASQLKVLSGIEMDPYDTYDNMKMIHEKYQVKPIYFFLVGKYSKYDTSLPRNNKNFQNLIKKVDREAEIGLHPSLGSNKNIDILVREKKFMEQLIEKPVTKSRNHYLYLKLPTTYEILIQIGIENDYTMGFGEAIGFRAGISTPFYFYNLEKEVSTKLLVHPFSFMDGTFKYYLGQNPTEAIRTIATIIQTIKNAGGNLISLWHNESLSNFRVWKGWQNFYQEMIIQAVN